MRKKKESVNPNFPDWLINEFQKTNDLFHNPNLMEMEVSYWRDNGFEFKALIDADDDDNLTVIHTRWDAGELDIYTTQKIRCGDGSDETCADPAMQIYDAIKFKGW